MTLIIHHWNENLNVAICVYVNVCALLYTSYTHLALTVSLWMWKACRACTRTLIRSRGMNCLCAIHLVGEFRNSIGFIWKCNCVIAIHTHKHWSQVEPHGNVSHFKRTYFMMHLHNAHTHTHICNSIFIWQMSFVLHGWRWLLTII